MSDMKRVTLTTIGDAVKKSPFGGSGSDQNTENFFSGAKGGTGSSGKDRKTVRLELKLFEPTTKSFPEFNFSKLVREEQKRQRKVEKKSTTNGFLPEPEDNSDVARIARELEKKYGAGTAYSSSGKFARPSQLDYCDRGAGYDEEDSFIDNTEAYDEIIPEEIETVCGGFYINSGQLEFKKLSNFERPEDAIRMPKRKKRALSSSSDDSSDRPEVAKAAPKKVTKKKEELGAGSATSGTDSTAGKAGKVGRKRLNGHVVKKVKMTVDKQLSGKATASKEEKKKKKGAKDANAETATGKDVKVVKTTTVKDMLRAKRDSLRKMEQEKKGGRSSGSGSSSEAEEDENEATDEGSDSSDSDSSESGSDDSESDSGSASEHEKKVDSEAESKKQKEIKLPDNLPDHLVQDLSSLKGIAKNTSGKLNFFDVAVADLLLQIDVSSRMCGGSARNAIYKHLELHLQVSRQTLMVKIKKIRIRKEDNKVKKALNKLEDAVTELMPKVITNYENERQKAIELRNALPTTSESVEKPEIKHPKKKFPWNDQLRTLLFDVAAIRKQSFHILRPRKETEEEYVHSYLKKSVVPLWPSGWMKFEELQKELDRRKKFDTKAAIKEIKKTVHLPAATVSAVPQPAANGPASKQDTVLTTAGKPGKAEEKKPIRPAQSSPVITATNMAQPSPSTSPAGLKKTSDHSIINIISSPPSKSSSHSSHSLPQQQSLLQQQQPQQPPRPQSQPPRTPHSLDEDLIVTHVINLDGGHSVVKKSPGNSTTVIDFPKDLRINSPALSSASSASSSRRQSSYQDPSPPMAHTTPTTSVPGSGRKDRKSLDDDSDSSIEIIGEYNVADKYIITPVQQKVDPLNLAMPSLNKDKYKGVGNGSSKSSIRHSNHSSSPGAGTSGMNINNNLEKPKYVAPSATSTSGSFALPAVTGLMQAGSSNMPPKASSIPGELDVIRIMKELQELQAVQMNSISVTSVKSDSPKPAHTFASSSKKTEPINHKTQSPGPVASQHPQQAHHKSPVVKVNGSSPASKVNTESRSILLKPDGLATSKKATQN